MTRRVGGRPASHWSPLQAAIAGEVILPDSPDYESVRKSALARFDHVYPQAVVRCRTPGDVAEAISFAQMSGLPISIRSGGHCFAGRSSGQGVVVEVSLMNTVSVSAGVATIGAGARLGQVYDELNDRDLTIPAGSCPTVG